MIELAGRRVAGDRRGAPVIWLAALLILLAGTYAIYSLGFYFGYSFDEEVHLAGLDRVHDLQSALYFVFDGQAGPLGRPLALTSFLLQMPSWPTEPADFARANTISGLGQEGRAWQQLATNALSRVASKEAKASKSADTEICVSG